MKVIKRIFSILGILLILAICIAIMIPFLYKGAILEEVKLKLNEELDAKVEFADLDLSLISSFPDIQIQLDQLSIDGIDKFEGIPLLNAKQVNIDANLMSVLRSSEPIKINEVTLVEPKSVIRILKNGEANYNIYTDEVPNTEADTGSLEFIINLEKYAIEDGHIIYDDQQAGTYLELKNLDHEGKGDFTQDVFNLDTKSKSSAITFKQDGTSYLPGLATELIAKINIDQKNKIYTLKENTLSLNNLVVNLDGSIQQNGDDTKMDFIFNAPDSEFKDFLSIVPAVYQSSFDNLDASGTVAISGKLKGISNAVKNKMPAYSFNVDIENGNMTYSNVDANLKGVFSSIKINNPTGQTDDVEIDVPKMNFNLNGNPFESSFSLKHPTTDPEVKGSAKGKLILEDIFKTFPAESISDMRGTIDADLKFNGKQSDIENERYDQVQADGQLSANNLWIKTTDQPAVEIESGTLDLNPKAITISSLKGKLGSSAFLIKGSLKDYLNYFNEEAPISGNIDFISPDLNLDEWIPVEDPLAENDISSFSETAEIGFYENLDVDIKAEIGNLRANGYEIKDLKTTGHLKNNRLDIANGSFDLGESDFEVSGALDQLFDYAMRNKVLKGDLNLTSKKLNLNDFMEEETGAESDNVDSMLTILVPDNFDLNVAADIQSLNYGKTKLANVEGGIKIADNEVQMQNVKADAFGGQIDFSGVYNTADVSSPYFSFKHSLANLSFQKTFDQINSFKILAPIAQFIQGAFNSTLVMEGKLGENMMPDFGSLNASGIFETVNGVLNGFAPLTKVADDLKVDALKTLELKNTKNWFEVINGTTEIKEFDYSYKSMNMKISGKHSFTKEIDYLIKAKIPRKLFDQNKIGEAANTGLNALSQQAQKLGLDLKAGEFVNVNVNVTGTIFKPKIGIKLVGTNGQTVEDEIKDQITQTFNETKDSIKNVVNDKIDKTKADATQKVDSLKAVAEQKADSLRKVAEEKVNSAVDTAVNIAKDRVNEEINKSKEKVKDQVGSKVDTLIRDKVGTKLDSTLGTILGTKKDSSSTKDEIKDKLEKWNPFKKKKKEE